MCYTHKGRTGSFWITNDVFNIFVDPKIGWSLYAREIFQLTCLCTLVLENTPLSPWKEKSKATFLAFFFCNVLHEGLSRTRIQLFTYFPFLPVLPSHFLLCGCQWRAVRVNLLAALTESSVFHSAQLIS